MENACLYKLFLSMAYNKVSAPSSALYSQTLFYPRRLTIKRYNRYFYMRGLFKLFPPIYLPYSIILNGLSSPESHLDLNLTNIKGLPTLMPAQRYGSLAQQPTTFNYIEFRF